MRRYTDEHAAVLDGLSDELRPGFGPEWDELTRTERDLVCSDFSDGRDDEPDGLSAAEYVRRIGAGNLRNYLACLWVGEVRRAEREAGLLAGELRHARKMQGDTARDLDAAAEIIRDMVSGKPDAWAHAEAFEASYPYADREG